MEGTQLEIPKVCRGLDYYLDPLSDKQVELGTQEYPYRTVKAVTSEILNNIKIHNISINIYMKDSYVEDGSLVFMNISNVRLTTHPDLIITRRAVMTLTEFDQPGLSSKARFHLLKNIDMPIQDNLNNGEYGDYEKQTASILNTNFILRAGFALEDVDVYREDVDIGKNTAFMTGIYLQSLSFNLSKCYKILRLLNFL